MKNILFFSYSPDGTSPPPRWSCFLCALGLFIYQSLDAIDGKQARRTNSSSPLGELFDHGCDSLSTIFVALSACISCQLGHYPAWLFFQCFCAIVLFYCAHWQTYVSGTLRFGKVDVTEAQMTIIGIHMISAIFGPEIWLTKVRLSYIFSRFFLFFRRNNTQINGKRWILIHWMFVSTGFLNTYFRKIIIEQKNTFLEQFLYLFLCYLDYW